MRTAVLCSLLAFRLLAADLSPFAYEKSLPLDSHQRETANRNGIRVATLDFAVTPKAAPTGCS